MAEAARVTTNTSGILNKGEFGYPSGHLGHLTTEQIQALADFKELCVEKGLYTPATSGTPASHNDETLL